MLKRIKIDSFTGVRRLPFILYSASLFIWALVLYTSWQSSPFWPDSGGYANSLKQGLWVAHPPGYLGFMGLAHLLMTFPVSSHLAAQLACLLLTLAAFITAHRLFRLWLDPAPASFLGAAFVLGWLPLMLSRTGSSHVTDLFTTSLVLICSIHVSRKGTVISFACFFASLWFASFFRLTTLIFLAPLALLLTVYHSRNVAWWISGIACLAVVLLQQAWIIRLSGGWEAYSSYASAMNEGNVRASLLLSGLNSSTLLNCLRSLLWWTLSSLTPLVVICMFYKKKNNVAPDNPREGMILLFALLGPLFAATFYLATHPGYLAPAVVPAYALAAWFWKRWQHDISSKTLSIVIGSAVLIPALLFILGSPWMQPKKPWQALANALVLQYSKGGFKAATWKSTSRWLKEMDRGDLVPKSRLEDLKDPDAL